MGVLKKIRLIPRIKEHFIFEGRRVKSVHGHGDGVGVGLHIERSVLDVDLGLPGDEMIVFLTWEDYEQIGEAFDISDKETLKLRKGKGWETGPRPYDKKGLKVHEFM